MYLIKRTNLILMLLHSLFWLLSFTQGIFQLYSLPSAIYKVGIPTIVIILIILKFLDNRKIIIPFFKYITLFIIVTVISYLYIRTEVFTLIYFLYFTCINYFYFITLINENDTRILNYVYKLVITLFLLQIPASIIKFTYLGQSEKGSIGTLSTDAGSLSSIVPLVAISYLFSAFLYNRQKKYLLLILGFVAFGIIGEKRIIVGMIPLVIILTYAVYLIKLKRTNLNLIFKYLMIVLFLGSFLLYMGIRLNPSLNREHKIMGSFDIDYALNYALNYENRKNKTFSEMPRVAGIIYFTKYLYKEGITNFLIGDGAGRLIESQYTNQKGSMLNVYGVRYGGRMGFIWLYLQVGILGVLFYLLFYFSLFRILWKNYIYKFECLAFLIIGFVFLIDFLIYSDTCIKYTALNSAFLTLGAYILHDIRKRYNEVIVKSKTN